MQVPDGPAQVVGLQGGLGGSVEKLEAQHRKLHFPQSSPAPLNLALLVGRRDQLVLRPGFLLEEFPQGRRTQTLRVNEGLQGLKGLVRRFLVARHPPAPDPRAPFPHLPVSTIILLQPLPGADQGATVTLGTKTKIDPVNQLPALGVQICHQGAGQPCAGILIVPFARQKDQIQIGKEIQVGRAQLAEGQNRNTFGLSPIQIRGFFPGQRQGRSQDKLRQQGVPGRGLRGCR